MWIPVSSQVPSMWPVPAGTADGRRDHRSGCGPRWSCHVITECLDKIRAGGNFMGWGSLLLQFDNKNI